MFSWTSTPVICLVTDRRVLTGGAPRDDGAAVERLLGVIGECGDAGVDLVQIREAGLSDRRLVELVRRAVERVRGTPARVLVNDRADVAVAAGAHGVHLKDDGRSPARVRSLGPPDWIVGRSVHGLEGALRADRSDAVDYLLAGTVFATPSKPGRLPLGLHALCAIAGAVTRPVLAIGGVGVAEVEAVASTGVAGLAGIRVFRASTATSGAPTIAARVEAVRDAFRRGRPGGTRSRPGSSR